MFVGGVGWVGGVNSLTISELECSIFFGLSAPRLMCEEITLSTAPKPGENRLLRHNSATGAASHFSSKSFLKCC